MFVIAASIKMEQWIDIRCKTTYATLLHGYECFILSRLKTRINHAARGMVGVSIVKSAAILYDP